MWKSVLLDFVLYFWFPLVRCLLCAQLSGMDYHLSLYPNLIMVFYNSVPLQSSSYSTLNSCLNFHSLPEFYLLWCQKFKVLLRSMWKASQSGWFRRCASVGPLRALLLGHSLLRHSVPYFRWKKASLTIPTPPNTNHLVVKECCHSWVQSLSCSKCSVILDGWSKDS